MTREQLLYNICPQHSINICDNISCHDCYELLNCYLDSYDKHVIAQYEAEHGNLADTIRDIHDNVAKQMYNKAVDDFANKLKEECRMHYIDCDPYFGGIQDSILYEDSIDEIAEQLKEKDNENRN